MLASNTDRLDLYKVDPETDGNDTFNIGKMLNDNWNKIDESVAMVDENGNVVNKDGSIAGGVTKVNDKTGEVVLNADDVGAETPKGSQTKATKAKEDAIEFAKLHGLGSLNSLRLATDLDLEIANGWVQANINTLNVPNNFYGVVRTEHGDISRISQTAYYITGSSTIPKVLIRSKGDKWTEWVEQETTIGANLKSDEASAFAINYAKGYGIGSNRAKYINSGDLNTYNEGGFYYSGAVLNRPPGVGNGFLIVSPYTSGYTSQIFIVQGTLRMFIRASITENTWGAWSEIETTQGAQDKVNSHAGQTDVHGLNSTSLSLGYGADGRGINSIGIGFGAEALGNYSTAIGYEANSSSISSFALGYRAHTEASASIAIGGNANASGSSSVALGDRANSTKSSSVAIGTRASATGSFSVAVGYNSESLNENEGVLGGASNVNAWKVPGSLSVEGTKNFEMPHPHPDKKDTHRLRHSAVESPTAGDNLYRFEIEATEALQEVELQLPDYFEHLNKNVDVWVNGVGHFGNAYGKVEGNTLKVNCEYAGKYNVLVIGTRNDEHQSVQDWDIMGVEREVGESWTGETYVFEVDEILEIEEIREEDVA